MSPSQNDHRPSIALVLGGGGSAGNAWLIGVVAGLAAGGVDVSRADVVIGTSAGATAAAQLAGPPPGELLNGVLSAPGARPGSAARDRPPLASASSAAHLQRTEGIIAAAADNADLAAGYERVLVLSPLGGRTRFPAAWRFDLATQIERLRADDSRAEAIFPDREQAWRPWRG